ncbi:MAG: mechanosensitive ion channel protein MscS [Legionellales bacterium]|nr:mechanosensitive ion channel protein MscS [Legionellales bacterium]|tara:strand:+ start:152 stop:739 length:588 start_codon:yes stop_codon:yes gene_type:complete
MTNITHEAAVEVMDVSHLLKHVVEHAWILLIDALPKIIVSIIIFAFFVLLTRIVDRAMYRVSQRTAEMRAPVVHFLRTLVKTVLYIIGAITALGSAGVEVSAMVASLGLSGVAISFALKDTLSNIVAGVMIMFYQPFRIGNTIRVDDIEGKVTSINIRYTSLMAKSGDRSIIPNAKMLTETITIPAANPNKLSEQ